MYTTNLARTVTNREGVWLRYCFVGKPLRPTWKQGVKGCSFGLALWANLSGPHGNEV